MFSSRFLVAKGDFDRTYWFITFISFWLQLSGLREQLDQLPAAPHTPFSVPFWFGKPGASSDV